MTKNVTITWDLPTTRTSGFPLDVIDIEHTRVALSADGGTSFGTVGTRLPTDPQEFLLGDVDIGDWLVRLTVVDTEARESSPVDTAFNVPDETPPGSVLNVNITMA
jgi:hypothetical protein